VPGNSRIYRKQKDRRQGIERADHEQFWARECRPAGRRILQMGFGKKELILIFEKSMPAGRPIWRIRTPAGRPNQESVRKNGFFACFAAAHTRELEGEKPLVRRHFEGRNSSTYKSTKEGAKVQILLWKKYAYRSSKKAHEIERRKCMPASRRNREFVHLQVIQTRQTPEKVTQMG
jgi:hypothetical protein